MTNETTNDELKAVLDHIRGESIYPEILLTDDQILILIGAAQGYDNILKELEALIKACEDNVEVPQSAYDAVIGARHNDD